MAAALPPAAVVLPAAAAEGGATMEEAAASGKAVVMVASGPAAIFPGSGVAGMGLGSEDVIEGFDGIEGHLRVAGGGERGVKMRQDESVSASGSASGSRRATPGRMVPTMGAEERDGEIPGTGVTSASGTPSTAGGSGNAGRRIGRRAAAAMAYVTGGVTGVEGATAMGVGPLEENAAEAAALVAKATAADMRLVSLDTAGLSGASGLGGWEAPGGALMAVDGMMSQLSVSDTNDKWRLPPVMPEDAKGELAYEFQEVMGMLLADVWRAMDNTALAAAVDAARDSLPRGGGGKGAASSDRDKDLSNSMGSSGFPGGGVPNSAGSSGLGGYGSGSESIGAGEEEDSGRKDEDDAMDFDVSGHVMPAMATLQSAIYQRLLALQQFVLKAAYAERNILAQQQQDSWGSFSKTTPQTPAGDQEASRQFSEHVDEGPNSSFRGNEVINNGGISGAETSAAGAAANTGPLQCACGRRIEEIVEFEARDEAERANTLAAENEELKRMLDVVTRVFETMRLPTLLKMAICKDRYLVQLALRSLACVSYRPEMKDAVIEGGCPKLFLSYMGRPDSEVGISQILAASLEHLAASPVCQAMLAQGSGLRRLTTLTAKCEDSTTLHQLLGIIATICAQGSYHGALKACNVVFVLASRATYPSVDIRCQVGKALSNIAQFNYESEVNLVDERLVGLIVSLASTTPDARLYRFAARALLSLVQNKGPDQESIHKMIYKVGGARLLYSMASSPDEILHYIAREALMTLGA